MIVNPINFIYSLFEEPSENSEPMPPWKLALYSASLAALTTFSIMRLAYKISWKAVGRKVVQMVPSIDKKLEEDMLKIERELEEKCYQNEHLGEVFLEIPDEGVSVETILKRFQNKEALPIENIHLNEQIDLILRVYNLVLNKISVNKNDGFLISKLEKEIVRMFCNKLKGDIYTCGNITYDATASIRHAVFSARETAKVRGLDKDWEMIVPESAHPAFDKIANEYNITLIKTDVYPSTHSKAFQADLDQIRSSISPKTILIALSYPNYPYGVVDPIAELSNLLESVDGNQRIGLHVDASLGGLVAPWMDEAGYGDNLSSGFGFDIPRITSLSVNTHTFGRSKKGASVVLYRNEKWREHQMFVTTEWAGGVYCTAGLDEREADFDVAGTWALMVALGKKGFVNETKKLIHTARELVKRLRDSNLEVFGEPKLMVIAFGFKDNSLPLKEITTHMKEKGWSLRLLHHPVGLQVTVSLQDAANPEFVNEFMRDLNQIMNSGTKKPLSCPYFGGSIDKLEARAFIPKV
jgi:sphinganine-1-phosphate aldolase